MILAGFDFNWFMTVPGMLITGGVLLLIVALIIFIVTGSKEGKEKKEKNVAKSIVENTKAVDTDVTPQDVVKMPQVGVAEMTPSAVEEPKVFTTPIPMEPIPEVFYSSNGMDENAPYGSSDVMSFSNDVVATAEPIRVVSPTNPQEEPVIPMTVIDQSTHPVVEQPAVAPQMVPPIVEQPVVAPQMVSPVVEQPAVAPQTVPPVVEQPLVAPQMVSPVVEQPAVAPQMVSPVSEPTLVASAPVEEKRPIYGGASPVIPNITVDQNTHRAIYGGADPMENTQSIPRVEPTVPVNDSSSFSVATSTPVLESASAISTPVVEQPTVPLKEEPVVSGSVMPKKQEEVEIESLF